MSQNTLKQAWKRGAEATNKILTPEIRSKAAKKGWKLRKKKLNDKQKRA